MVKEFEWLSDKGMETAVRKIVLMTPSYGVSDHVYDLSDITPSENMFENYVNIWVSRRKFAYSQLYLTDEERGTVFQSNFDVNAYYNGGLNNITLTTGLITLLIESDMTYEEKIAELDHWTDKQETKAAVDNLIRDTLWAELPECYDEISISEYRQRIYEYVYTRYKVAA